MNAREDDEEEAGNIGSEHESVSSECEKRIELYNR
jgi:hypothetical protein